MNSLGNAWRKIIVPNLVSELNLNKILFVGQSFRWKKLSEHSFIGGINQYSYRILLDPPHNHFWVLPFGKSVLPSKDLNLSLSTQSAHSNSFEKSSKITTVKPKPIRDCSDESLNESISLLLSYFRLEPSKQSESEPGPANVITTIPNPKLKGLYQQWANKDSFFSENNLAKPGNKPFLGIKQLNQPPFECLLSFICSTNNNVSRITSMVSTIESYGNLIATFSLNDPEIQSLPLSYAGAAVNNVMDIESQPKRFRSNNSLLAKNSTNSEEKINIYSWPTLDTLVANLTETKLRDAKFGYRASYIMSTLKFLHESGGQSHSFDPTFVGGSKWLENLYYSSQHNGINKSRQQLINNCIGVGRKVADCVLLCSFGNVAQSIVPLDVHMIRLTKKKKIYTMTKEKGLTSQEMDLIQDAWIKKFGDKAGWVQSVLFAADLK